MNVHCLKKILSFVITKYQFYNRGKIAKFNNDITILVKFHESRELSIQMSNLFLDNYQSCVSQKSVNKLIFSP